MGGGGGGGVWTSNGIAHCRTVSGVIGWKGADGSADDVSHCTFSGKRLRPVGVLKLCVSHFFVCIVYNISVLCNGAGGKA